jgi:glycerol-3-phosphate dehydrogenase
MILYDLLSYDKGFAWDPSKRLPWHRLLSLERTTELEPLVKADNLTGGILYYDCANLMPERLTLAFILSAVKAGAEVANYAKVEDFLRVSDRVSGVAVRDLLNEKIINLRAKLVVNCGGPWADLLLGIARGKPGEKQIRRSEGIHLITRRLTKEKVAIGGLTPTGRACNLIPWRGHTLIGTTDQEYIGDPDKFCVTRQKIEEYIAEVNAAFGNSELLRYSDVVYAYGGLRPLVDDQTEDVYKTSRKYEIFDHEQEGLPGLITVEGGKYTTSRKLAENVLKTINKKFGKCKVKSITASQYLVGCEIPDITAFVEAAKQSYRDFPEHSVDYLARIYGTALPQVMEISRNDKQYAVVLNADGEMPSQAVYAIRHEMARTLMDILIRRTGIGTLGDPGSSVLEKLAEIAARELNWSQSRVDQELETASKALSLP